MKKTVIIVVVIFVLAAIGVIGYFMLTEGENESSDLRTYLGHWVISTYLADQGPTNVILREDNTFVVSQPGRYIPDTGWMDMFFTPFAELLPGYSDSEPTEGGTSWDYTFVTHGTFSVERRNITFTLYDGTAVTYDFMTIGDEETTMRRLRMIVTRVPARSIHINRIVFERA